MKQASRIAVAIGAALGAAGAFAQGSSVQLYGRVNLGFDHYSAEGARDQGGIPGSAIEYEGRNRVFDNSSRVGLRGSEDLGGGLRAIFQIESGANVDTGSANGQNGRPNGSTGTWATRDSFVGLDSAWGRLTFGRQSIWYSNGELAQFASNYINTEVPWTDGRGLGRMPTPASRTSNVVLYTTPRLAGFNASLYYSPNAQEAVQHNGCVLATPAATSCAAGTGQDADGRIWGATVRGAFGPFHGQVDYVDNRGNSPLATVNSLGAAVSGGTDQAKTEAVKAGIGWKYLPGANLSFIYVWAKSNAVQGLSAGDEAKQDAWTINWEHTFRNVQAMAQFGMLNGLKDCDSGIGCADSEAKAWMLGARYLLSKRTWLYASYNEVDNDGNQFADYVSAGYTSVASPVAVPYGADPRVWAVGMFHAF